MKKKLLLLCTIMILTVSLVLTACNSTPSQPEDNNQPVDNPDDTQAVVPFTGQYVVDADYLKAAVGKDNVIIIDARGPEAAANGTIEGAVAMAWQEMASVADGKSGDAMWGTLLPAEQLATVLGNKGLAKDKEILLFASSQSGWGDDGRILWGLIAAGYENAKMVDGGYDYLAEQGIPTAAGPSTLDPVTVAIDTIDETHTINTDALKADYANYVVVDVRAQEEYDGAVNYGEAKGGHLPGAILIEFTSLFNEDTTLKSVEEIQAMLSAAGLKTDDKIATYCTAGIRSAYMQLIMQMCGYENAVNYDESYYRWCAVEEVE